jgi:hypothetical protein
MKRPVSAATLDAPDRNRFVREITHGRGADVFFECAAYRPSMPQAARYRRLYPLDAFVSHRHPLEDARGAVEKSMPWS